MPGVSGPDVDAARSFVRLFAGKLAVSFTKSAVDGSRGVRGQRPGSPKLGKSRADVGQDFLDGAPRQRYKPGIRLAIVRYDQGRLVERETASPVPRTVIHAQGFAESPSPRATEHASRGDHVGGRVAYPDTAEVYDPAEPAVADEHVRPQQVGVHPHRRSFPGRRF